MRTIKNKLLEQSDKSNRFSLTPTIRPILFIAIFTTIYFFLAKHHFFPLWIHKIYLGLKIYIALEILVCSSKTIMMPLLALATGLIILFTAEVYHITLLSTMECWQLIFTAIIGFVITIWLKF